MPYQLFYPWRKHPRLLHLHFSEALLVEDLDSSLAETLYLMNNAEAPIHILFDFSAVTQFPPNLHELLKKSTLIQHKQRGHWVFIQPNEFVSFAAKILRHQTGIAIEFMESEDRAWEFFNQMGIC